MFKSFKFTALSAALSLIVLGLSPSVQANGSTFVDEFPSPVSFNRWGGFQSLDRFDDFFGVDNFDGQRFDQVFLNDRNVERKLVCRAVPHIKIVQQRLLVLQEVAKKVITETICDVESQVIAFEQFHAGLGGFGRDIRRVPGGHRIGFDENIVGHFPKFINQDGHFNFDDEWSFTGRDLGRHSVFVDGSNWDDEHSFKRVHNAWLDTKNVLGHEYFDDDFDFDLELARTKFGFGGHQGQVIEHKAPVFVEPKHSLPIIEKHPLPVFEKEFKHKPVVVEKHHPVIVEKHPIVVEKKVTIIEHKAPVVHQDNLVVCIEQCKRSFSGFPLFK